MKNKLREMVVKRNEYLKQEEDFYKECKIKYGNKDWPEYDQHPEYEELRIKIHNCICENHKELPIEDIIEGLTSIGCAPNLLYDDSGNFAIGEDGMQGLMNDDSGDFSGTWALKKEEWKM